MTTPVGKYPTGLTNQPVKKETVRNDAMELPKALPANVPLDPTRFSKEVVDKLKGDIITDSVRSLSR